MRVINKQHIGVAAVAASLLLASGCAAQGQNSVETALGADRPSIDGDALRHGRSYDYDVKFSATEVAQDVDLTISGTVKSWSDGRAILEDDLMYRTAVLEIAVDQAEGELAPSTEPVAPPPRSEPAPSTVSAAPSMESTHETDDVPPGESSEVAERESGPGVQSIFVEVGRGDALVDENGVDVVEPEGYESTQLSVDDLAKAAPVGARVIFMGGPANTDDEVTDGKFVVVTQSWQPPIEGTELMAPLLQGLLFEDSDGNYASALVEQADVQGNGWPDGQEPNRRANGSEYEQLLEELF